jgi:hypothetical protein
MLDLKDLKEIRLSEPDDFLKIRETLSRIGVASKKSKTLYQSCHILHKQGRYFITHFKELFLLDGKTSDYTEDDKGRRNTIVNLLQEWGLLTLVDPKKSEFPTALLNQIKIIPYKEKSDWELVTKYDIGRTKRAGAT